MQEINRKENLRQIKFYNNLGDLSEDLLNDQLNLNSAEQYFDVLIDDEIPERIICPIIQDDKTKQFHVSKIFNWEDYRVERYAENIYADPYDTKDICN